MRYLFMVIGLFFFSPVNAICKWTDSQGQIHYGRRPPPGIACGGVATDRGASSGVSGHLQQDSGIGLRPGEQALLQDIRKRRQAERAARKKARQRQRKKAARVAASTAENQQKCENYQRRFNNIREQRRRGYKLSQKKVLNQQMAEVEQGIRTYCR